jgi:hypothetical protein
MISFQDVADPCLRRYLPGCGQCEAIFGQRWAADVATQPFERCALANIDIKPGVQRKPASQCATVMPFPLALRRYETSVS